LFPVGAAVRWVLGCAEVADGKRVRKASPSLFRGELAFAVEYVAAGFGLSSARDARVKGYIGAAPEPERFHTWFHWLAFTPTSVARPCETFLNRSGPRPARVPLSS
jgi:hypothetical protein